MLTSTPKTIQIDLDLFEDLYVYAARHADPDDPQFKRITIFVKKKLQALMKHELYSLYKAGSPEAIREKVQNKYLDAIDILEAFQWRADQGGKKLHDGICRYSRDLASEEVSDNE